MSDTTTCPSCSATLPAGAAFCTTCGTRLAAAPEAPTADATRVDNPGLHDATQVYAPPPPAAPAAPWQPADTGAAPPPLPGPPAAPTGWGAPAAPPPPAPAAPAAAWPPAAPTAPPPTTWGAPGAAPAAPPTWNQPAAPAWGAPAPVAAPTGASGGASPLGGLVAGGGALLVLVGLFTAWLGSNASDETITGWELLDSDNGFETTDPYLLLGLGLVGLAIAIVLFTGRARTPARIGALVAGVVVVVTHARDWLNIADIAEKLPLGVEITAQFGFYLGIVGGVLLAVSALLPAKK